MLCACVSVSVQAQDGQRSSSVSELTFETTRRQEGSWDVNAGVYRARYREMDRGTYHSVREYLESTAQDYGWSRPAEELELVREVNLTKSRHLTYQQTFAGLPVLDHTVRVNLDPQNRVSFVQNAYVAVETKEDLFDIRPAVTAEAAETIAMNDLAPKGGQFTEARLAIARPSYPLLVWEIIVWPEQEPAELRVLVDAQTGKILSAIDQAVSSKPSSSRKRTDGVGFVFNPGPLMVSGSSYTPPFVDNNDAANTELNATRTEVALLDLSQNGNGEYVLEGPYVAITGLTSGGTSVYTPPAEADPTRFRYDRSESGFEAVNAYYHVDTSQRYIQSLGIFGRQAAPFAINPQGLTRDDSFFFPNSNSISFGTGGVDDAEDATVVWHEYAHALLESAAPGLLGTLEGRAFHEGWADYWAASYSRSLVEAGVLGRSDWRKLFLWDSGERSLWSGRDVDHTGIYPQDICVTQSSACSVHDDGRMWATTMMEVYDQLGKTITDHLNLLSHSYLMAPMTFVDAAEAVIQADLDYYNGDHLVDLVSILGARGLVNSGDYGPFIQHTELTDVEFVSGSLQVEAIVRSSSSSIASVELVYWTDGNAESTVALSHIGDNVYSGALVLSGTNSTYRYYLRASDLGDREEVLPQGAPISLFSFRTGEDRTPPQVVHTSFDEVKFADWPLSFHASVSDNLGVSSVTMDYVIEDAEGQVQASGNLAFMEGESDFSALLDLPLEVLDLGGVLKYALVAVDASMNRNQTRLPSVGYYEPRIVGVNVLTQPIISAQVSGPWLTTGEWNVETESAPSQENNPPVFSTGSDTYSDTPLESTLGFGAINLSGFSQTYLQFWHFYSTEHDGVVEPNSQSGSISDGGFVQIRTQTTLEWTTIHPSGGYPGIIMAGTGNAYAGQPAFGGRSYGWRMETFELPSEAGVEVRFVFSTDNGNVLPVSDQHYGWKINSVAISTNQQQEAELPSFSRLPASSEIAALDDVLHLSVSVEDGTGVNDVFVDWEFTSSSGITGGTTRLNQQNGPVYQLNLSSLIDPSPGDGFSYSFRAIDPWGNESRTPAEGSTYSILFRNVDERSMLSETVRVGPWIEVPTPSGLSGWFIQGSNSRELVSLNFAPIPIPTNISGAYFTVNHSYEFGQDASGWVDISKDGGKSWVDLIPDTGYPGTIFQDDYPELEGNQAFVGNGSDPLRVDLSEYAGTEVQLRLVAAFSQSADGGSKWLIEQPLIRLESVDSVFETEIKSTLLQSYPNPFQVRTHIPWTLEKAADVQIRVYDLLGREVALLVNSFVEAGSHQVVFERGNLVAGMYLVQMTAGSTRKVQKVIISN